jgi:hypothetical protein
MDAWPPKLRLISIMATTHTFLLRSTEEGWPDENAQKTAQGVIEVIAHLFDSTSPLPDYWLILFAPTGPIQEIAIANKWHETYMKLATEFDGLVYLLKEKTSS